MIVKIINYAATQKAVVHDTPANYLSNAKESLRGLRQANLLQVKQ